MNLAFGQTDVAKSTHHLIVGHSYTTTMTLTLRRKPSTKDYTEGELFQGETKLCDTLEDVMRDIKDGTGKIKGRTAIPKGTYTIQWTYSPKFHRHLPLLTEVPWFSGIRIHSGNTAEDTSGCILCGVKERDGILTLSKVTTAKVCAIIQKAILDGQGAKIIIY